MKVYFSKQIERILEKVDFLKLGNKVGIKVHFGEKGCKTYLNPEIVKKVYDKVVSLGREVSLVECNVLYRGSRTNKKDHIKTAKEHGFDFAPIDILDGDLGEEFIEVDVNGKNVKLGKGLKKYDSLIVISHFTGHIMAGFGCAIKNLGMGLGSRAGKLDMHSNVGPFVNQDKCVGCGICLKNCDFNAIELSGVDGDKKAKIIPEKCSGCAMCIAVCPEKAISVLWEDETSERLQEKMIDYCEGVKKLIPNIVFINVLENITKDCDCFSTIQKPEIPDIGFLMSEDMVAIDKASLDLVNEKGFKKVQSHIGKNHQIEVADERLGSQEYEIEELK